ncbi:MAG TPA: efflux RND transporter permease subunit, partial [Kofleriaceae bacterium]|nr:efflux RND transporter permease subunit [Kofleriaceae bacterium]
MVAIAGAAVIASAAAMAGAGCGSGARPAAEAGGTVHLEAGWAGADAAEVEASLLTPLEHAVLALDGLANVRGVARAGGVEIDIRFVRGIARDRAYGAVTQAVQGALAQLPAGAASPMITAGRPSTWVYARGDGGDVELARVDVLTVPGVLRVDACGGRRPTVDVRLDPAALAARGLDAHAAIAALSHANTSVPSGSVASGSRQLSVRLSGTMSTIEDVAAIDVDGHGTHLGDVATISEADHPDCRVSGPAGALLRVGLAGDRDALAGARRKVEERLRAAGLTLLDRPLTVGVLTLSGEPDAVQAALGDWTRSYPDANAAVPAGGREALLIVPGHDPDSRATATVVSGEPSRPGLATARWGIGTEPLYEATVTGDDLTILTRRASQAVVALSHDAAVSGAGCPACATEVVTEVEIDRARATELHVSSEELAEAVGLAQRRAVSSLIDSGRLIDITVGVDPDRLPSVMVTAADGARVPLSVLAAPSRVEAPAQVVHVDGRRAITVWAQGKPGASRSAVKAA